MLILAVLFIMLRPLILCIDFDGNYASHVVVGLSSIDLNKDYFGRRFNQQPIAIFDLPEPSNTGKALVKFFTDMKTLSSRGMYIKDPEKGQWLHKPFLKGHLADAVARYVIDRVLCWEYMMPHSLCDHSSVPYSGTRFGKGDPIVRFSGNVVVVVYRPHYDALKTTSPTLEITSNQSNVCWNPTLESSICLRTTLAFRLLIMKLWSKGKLFMRLVLPFAKGIRISYGIQSYKLLRGVTAIQPLLCC